MHQSKSRTPPLPSSLSHKKHKKNVNKSVKGTEQDVHTVFSNKPYMLTVRFTYSTWTLFTLPFSNFLFKNVERRQMLSFVKVLGSIFEVLYTCPVFYSSLICRVQTLKNP